jgi:protein involved in polysaccharide export with SLBB domain
MKLTLAKTCIKLCFFVIIFYMPLLCYSQHEESISSYDLKTIEVDELSDAQIQEFVNRASESGMTMEQLEALALSRGMAYSEIVKLRSRINSLDEKSNNENKKKTQKDGGLRQVDDSQLSIKKKEVFDLITEDKKEEEKQETEKTSDELPLFGMNLFQQENLTFMSSINIPTPKNYVIGPGDELLIEVYGASQESYALMVTPEGWVKMNSLSPIRVSGLTINDASALLKRHLSTIYSGMKGSQPNTFAEISLGNLRSITVSIAGEVQVPGTYTIPSLASVYNVMYLAGGPNETGSFRKIQVIRNNEIIAKIDLYDFLMGGVSKNNIRLEDDDIIFINEYVSRIKVDGEVKRPAIYEAIENESIDNLISYAGGFSEQAYSEKLKVVRNTSSQKKVLDIAKSEYSQTAVQNGDEIMVDKVLSRFENRVSIKGAVYREGNYELDEGMLLSDLIQKAEGLREDAYMWQASIYRLQNNLKTKVIPVDLTSIINGSNDFQLQREDVVYVSSIFDLEETYTIQVSGEVQNPGEYPFYNNMNIGELLRLAGGLKESASLSRVEIARRIKDNKTEASSLQIAKIFNFPLEEEKTKSFELQPYDILFIRRSPGYEIQQLARVEGEVTFPGEYSLTNKEERISNLIERAGGLTPEAYPKGATLYRRIEVDKKARNKALKQLEKTGMDSLQIDMEESASEQAIGIDLPSLLNAPGSEYDLTLKDGDRLKIPTVLQTVRLSGALLYPVTVRYEKGKNLKGYVTNAGGFAENARKNKAYVMYANGSVDRTKSFMGIKNYPNLEPGAEIIIPQKSEKERMSPQQAISTSSAIASLALVLVTLIGRF